MQKWTQVWWQWRGSPHSPNLWHYWNLAIRLLNVISTTLVEGVLSLCRETVGVFYSLSRLSKLVDKLWWYYLSHTYSDNWLNTFLKSICPKVNVIAGIEFELGFFDVTVLHVSPYTNVEPTRRLEWAREGWWETEKNKIMTFTIRIKKNWVNKNAQVDMANQKKKKDL